MWKTFIIAQIMLLSTSVFSQKEDHQWIFNFSSVDSCDLYSVLGESCGASILDFNTLPPRGYREEKITLDMKECNAGICNSDGKLILYSNGQSIHGSSHIPIQHGDTINYSPKWSWLTWKNENEEPKPSGFRGVQGVGFIPQPNSDTIIALYHNYEHHEQGEVPTGYLELWMSKIAPTINGGYEVVVKDRLVNDKIFRFGAITACRHGNGRDWWMLQFNKDTVYHYIIDPKGLKLDHESILPFELRGTTGQCKFSPQGDKFALYGSWDLGFSGAASKTDLMIADFDRCTGNLINPIFSFQPGEHAVLDAGLEFSPDGKALYISTVFNIYQFDLLSNNVFSSREEVANYDGSTCNTSAEFPRTFGQMQLGPDNKIYNGRNLQCYNIHVINHPNEKGIACDVQQNVIELPTYTSGTIPNFNTYRLGPLDGSSCDSLGIDNEPVSRFWYAQDSIDFLTTKFWDVSYFRPASWSWDMGDGSSYSVRHPLHSYTEKGIYEVCLTVSNENSSHTSCQTINIGMVSTVEDVYNYDISLFPNPTQGHLRMTFHDYLPKNAHIKFYDMSGQAVMLEALQGGANVLDVYGLVSGTYIYEVIDQGVVISSGKVLRID